MNCNIVKLHPSATVPQYQTKHSAGMDIHACIQAAVTLKPFERASVPTGLAIEITEGYEVQIRARSGLAAKYGICLTNGIGTIDADYRGEISVLLINLGQDDFTIEPGMRIAQMVAAKYESIHFNEVDTLSTTERSEGGFGSTGQ